MELAAKKKLEEASFCSLVLPAILQLWTMSDRLVRTALLQSLKALVHYTPAAAINKTIFDQILAGFADSNAK
jgi:hypothetical protein